MPATLPTGETIIMTTPNLSLEERVGSEAVVAEAAAVTVLETRLDTILPTLATKADIARLEGKMDAMNERLEGKIDAINERLNDGKIDNMGNRLLIKFGSVAFAIAAIAVAAAKYL